MRVQSRCTLCFWLNNADVSVPECLSIINMKITHHRGSKTRSFIDTGPLPVTSTTYPAGAITHQKRVAFQASSVRIIALIPHKIPQGVRSQNYKRFEIIIVTPHTAPHMGLEGALGGAVSCDFGVTLTPPAAHHLSYTPVTRCGHRKPGIKRRWGPPGRHTAPEVT